MSDFVCAISGVYPEEPVISTTGYIFEKRVIEKYLKANGDVCPLTSEPLTLENLLPIKVSKYAKPRPAATSSIPGMLMSLQNEWDSLLTEVFNLRVHLDTVRKQLSHALYQHDAACRVIARLLREKEAAKEVTAQLQRETKTFTEAQAQGLSVVQEIGLSECLLEELQSHAKMLLGKRKKRDLSTLPSKNVVSTIKEIASFTPHSSTLPGITRCLIHPLSKLNDTTKCVWTAGMDGAVHLFDVENEKTLCRLHGHLKRVNSVACSAYRSGIVVTASDDKTVRVWSSSDNDLESYKMSYLLRHHTKGVTNVCINPMANLFISTSRDLSWILHDLNSGHVLRAYRDLPCAMPVLMFHPDGMLIGASGMNNNIYIYDVKGDCTPTIVLSGHETPVTDLQFSENGYYLATASACPGGTVKLWDLRKSLNFETIQPVNEDNTPFSPFKISFDDSGNYLAVTGGITDSNDSTHYSAGCASIYSFVSKTQLEKIKSLISHTNLVTDASFGRNTQSLFTCSLDRTVKYWHVNDEEKNTI